MVRVCPNKNCRNKALFRMCRTEYDDSVNGLVPLEADNVSFSHKSGKKIDMSNF